MEELTRKDLVNPYEQLPRSVREPFPVFGGAIVRSDHEIDQSVRTLKFIELTDTMLNPAALVEHIGDRALIAYCSDWGSGIEGVECVRRDNQDMLNDFFSPHGVLDRAKLPEEASMVISTLAASFENTERKFYAVGDIELGGEIEEADLEREASYREFFTAIANFHPVADQIKLLDDFTAKAAIYNNAVTQQAYEELVEILDEHKDERIAVILDPSFQSLPRHFTGEETGQPLLLQKSRMPWDVLGMQMISHDAEVDDRFFKRDSETDAQRFWLEQATYLKQLGQEVPKYILINSLMSLVHRHLIAVGPGKTVLEYRLVSDQDNGYRDINEGKFMLIEQIHWEKMRKALEDGSDSLSFESSFREFAIDWLRLITP